MSKKTILENVTSLALALFLVLVIRSSLVEAFKIPSGSMIPTLLVGDHIFVNKMAYGLKVPFSDWIGEKPIYITSWSPPKRGDIIVFKYPENPDIYYIKRVIGEPGDLVEVKEGDLFVNDQKIDRSDLSKEEHAEIISTLDSNKYNLDQLQIYYEALNGDRPMVMVDSSSYHGNYSGPHRVPEDQFFVMGDNRNHSNDSRYWGYVPKDNIKGKAMFIWLSIWLNFSKDEYFFRPSRIGTVLN